MTESATLTTAAIGSAAAPEPPATPLVRRLSHLGIVIAIAAVLLWSAGEKAADIRPLELLRSSPNMARFAAAFLHPDFSDWRLYTREMIITVQIAIWGTFLAVIFAVPFGLLSAANISPVWIRQPVRRLMDAARATNEMVFALIFMVAVGLGPFAGVLALFVHTLGTLAKLFSEAVEAIDPCPVEGIRATGAGKLEEIAYGILPQVMPLWVSYSLYRFEANVRSATVLGIIGAGGIGYILTDEIRSFNYSATAAILLIIIVTVVAIDMASAYIRKRYI